MISRVKRSSAIDRWRVGRLSIVIRKSSIPQVGKEGSTTLRIKTVPPVEEVRNS